MTEFYIVEGGIASGKTTFLRNLHGKFINGKPITVITEPVEQWCNTEQGNILKAYCEDKRKNAFSFQTLAMTTLASQRDNIQTDGSIVVMERSLGIYCNLYPITLMVLVSGSALNVFQKHLEDTGYITPPEGYILRQLYEHLMKRMPQIKGIIYMDTPLEIATQRIQTRAKEADQSINSDYMSKLVLYYTTFMDTLSNKFPVLYINPYMLETREPVDIMSSWINEINDAAE